MWDIQSRFDPERVCGMSVRQLAKLGMNDFTSEFTSFVFVEFRDRPVELKCGRGGMYSSVEGESDRKE